MIEAAVAEGAIATRLVWAGPTVATLTVCVFAGTDWLRVIRAIRRAAPDAVTLRIVVAIATDVITDHA